jgi:hypothetical protein
MNKTARDGGEVCVRQPDGSYSDAAIHEAIMAGVDDSEFRAQSRAKMHARGVPAAVLNRLYPGLPPLPEEGPITPQY